MKDEDEDSFVNISEETEDDIVIAEAELGIESLKVIISPYDDKNREVFVKHGYTVMDSKSFLEKYSAQ